MPFAFFAYVCVFGVIDVCLSGLSARVSSARALLAQRVGGVDVACLWNEVCRRRGCGRRSAIDAWCDRRRCRRRLLVLPSRLCIFRRFGVFHKEQTNSKHENIRRNVSKMRHIIHIISKNVLYSASGGECFAKTFYASYKNFFGYVSRLL